MIVLTISYRITLHLVTRTGHQNQIRTLKLMDDYRDDYSIQLSEIYKYDRVSSNSTNTTIVYILVL